MEQTKEVAVETTTEPKVVETPVVETPVVETQQVVETKKVETKETDQNELEILKKELNELKDLNKKTLTINTELRELVQNKTTEAPKKAEFIEDTMSLDDLLRSK